MTVAHQSARCTSGEVSIFYRRLGRPGGIPLVLLHGLSYFSWDWLEVAQALGGEREVVAMDMRGFGDSGWSATRDYGVVTMARDIRALLEHLGWQRAIVSGHSMGGRSAACFAATDPARAAGLVLIDYSPENLPEGTQRTARMVAGVPDVFPSIEAAMAYFGQQKRERFEAYLKPVEGGYAVKRDPHFRDQFRKLLATGERPKLDVDMWQVMKDVALPHSVPPWTPVRHVRRPGCGKDEGGQPPPPARRDRRRPRHRRPELRRLPGRRAAFPSQNRRRHP